MSSFYYLRTTKGEMGPISESQVAFKLKTKQITEEDLYWRDGNSDWLPLSLIASELSIAEKEPGVIMVGSPHSVSSDEVSVSSGSSGSAVGVALIAFGILITIFFGAVYDTSVETSVGINVHNLQKGNEQIVGVIVGMGLAILGGVLMAKSKA